MTKDQMCDIIDELFVARWPDMAEKGSKYYLGPVLLNEVFFPRMSEFRSDDARAGAKELVATKRFSPIVEDWVQATKKAMAERLASTERRLVDCPFCRDAPGMIFASCIVDRDERGKRTYKDFGHMDEHGLQADGGWRYSISMPCGCENTPRYLCSNEAARVKARAERVEVLEAVALYDEERNGKLPAWWEALQREIQKEGKA